MPQAYGDVATILRSVSGPTAPGSAASSRQVTYLDRIIDEHRAAAAADRRSVHDLMAQADDQPQTRGFRLALQQPGLQVIAEIKRRSPSKGDLHATLDPTDMAMRYEAGGAACLSVLTDTANFGGSVADLQTARRACSLPVLRKDFTVSEADVLDARIMGADAVLLIAAALSDGELEHFHHLALAHGLDVLVEIHDEDELVRAQRVGATLVGVNQRDLHTFQVDHERALRVGRAMPSSMTRVAESGVRGPADAASLAAAGFDAVLVGESLVTAGDPTASVAALRAAVESSSAPGQSVGSA